MSDPKYFRLGLARAVEECGELLATLGKTTRFGVIVRGSPIHTMKKASDMSNPRAPNEPCKCGRVSLAPWWESTTDAGNEGTDYVRHTRVSCLTRTARLRVCDAAHGTLRCTKPPGHKDEWHLHHSAGAPVEWRMKST